MQVLIVAKGPEIPRMAKSQLNAVRATMDQLIQDPRVKVVQGISGQSLGYAVWCEVKDLREAEGIAGLAQLTGLPNTEIIPLVPAEQFRAGLEEAEKMAGLAAIPLAEPRRIQAA